MRSIRTVVACTSMTLCSALSSAQTTELYESDCRLWRVNGISIHGPTMTPLVPDVAGCSEQNSDQRLACINRNRTAWAAVENLAQELAKRKQGAPLPQGVECAVRGTEASFAREGMDRFLRDRASVLIAEQVNANMRAFLEQLKKENAEAREKIIDEVAARLKQN